MTRFFVILWLVVIPVANVVPDELQRSIPDSEKALIARSKELRLDKHDLAAAENLLKDLLKRYPNYYKAHYNLGLVYQEERNYDTAIKELEAAKSIRESENLQDYSIYNTLGWVYMQKGETK